MSVEIVITGAGGALGSVMLRRLVGEGASAVGTLSIAGPSPAFGITRRVDLLDATALARLIEDPRPRIIIHAAAMTSVQAAFEKPDLARAVNVEATQRIVGVAERSGARLVYISTDMVFDGSAAPYVEEDVPGPLSIYGRTKAEAEHVVLSLSGSLVVRVPLLYGVPAVERPTTFLNQLRALQRGEAIKLFEDEFRTPIDLEDAASSVLLAARSDYSGLLHIAGPDRLSRLVMGHIMADVLGVSRCLIIAARQADINFPEPRPSDLSLSSGRFEATFGSRCGRSMSEVMKSIVRG
jgi:dTDP-4-dehydrorhamnose reductase